MDINENEEQIEELEPLADTPEDAVDPVVDDQAPADEEPLNLPDQDPPAADEEDQEDDSKDDVSVEAVEEQISTDVLPETEPEEDSEPVLEEELVPEATEADEPDEDDPALVSETVKESNDIPDIDQAVDEEIEDSVEPASEEEFVPEVMESDEPDEENPAAVSEQIEESDVIPAEDQDFDQAVDEEPAAEILPESELDEEIEDSVEPVLEEVLEAEVVDEAEIKQDEPDPIAEQTEISDEAELEAADPYRKHVLEIEPAIDDGRAWYVVHCYSGNEDKVRHNIMQRIESMTMDDLIFDVVVPTEDEVNIKNGERQTVEKKVFPGYILVNMILTEESWYMVRNTPGVTGFVGMGNDPTALQPEEVARILKRMESESPRINVTFRPGERVRIVDGPFEDFHGKVSEIDMDRATVRVMVNFFGRETPVELDFLQVEEA